VSQESTERSGRGVYGISVAAELSGVGPQTLRLYEERGLLSPMRSPGGTRRYSDDDLVRLERITGLLAEGVAAALRAAGANIGVQVLRYRTRSADRAVVEGFLQRCAFDDTVSLDEMEVREPLAAYLAGLRAADGSYEFRHEVHLMTWEQAVPA